MSTKNTSDKATRITSQDMESCIYRRPSEGAKQRPKTEVKKLPEDFVIYYTTKAKQQDQDEDGNSLVKKDGQFAYAKAVYGGSKPAYWVKSDGYRLVDPYGMFSLSKTKVPGLSKETYIKVKKAVFDLYLQFLKTKNNIHLDKANRENM